MLSVGCTTSIAEEQKFTFATKFRHGIAEHIIDRCTFAAGDTLLQRCYPSSDCIEWRPHRRGGYNARNANVSHLFLTRKQDFMQSLARADSGKYYFDVTAGLQPGEPDDAFGKVNDFYWLTHIEDIDGHIAVPLAERVTG